MKTDRHIGWYVANITPKCYLLIFQIFNISISVKHIYTSFIKRSIHKKHALTRCLINTLRKQ